MLDFALLTMNSEQVFLVKVLAIFEAVQRKKRTLFAFVGVARIRFGFFMP
jgi:hypothetical protein